MTLAHLTQHGGDIGLVAFAIVIFTTCYFIWIWGPGYKMEKEDQTAQARNWLTTNYYNVPINTRQEIADFYGIDLQTTNPSRIFDDFLDETATK